MTDLTLPLDYATIEQILPHRYPFLLVSSESMMSPGTRNAP
jgi:3-hydroxymyristoyl/3-hydroxydecanoyl-(acyl carrier protein) dehydratase